MCKMVLEITKETWGKCRIKTVKPYNEEMHIIKLWQKWAMLKNKQIIQILQTLY